MPKIEGDGKSWLRRPKFYKGVEEPYKKKIQLLSAAFLILRRTKRDMIKNVYCSTCEVSVILVIY